MKRADYSLNTEHRQFQRIAVVVSGVIINIVIFQTERESSFKTFCPLTLYYTLFRLWVTSYLFSLATSQCKFNYAGRHFYSGISIYTPSFSRWMKTSFPVYKHAYCSWNSALAEHLRTIHNSAEGCYRTADLNILIFRNTSKKTLVNKPWSILVYNVHSLYNLYFIYNIYSLYFLHYLWFSVSTHKTPLPLLSSNFYMHKLQLQYISYRVLQKKPYTVIPNKHGTVIEDVLKDASW